MLSKNECFGKTMFWKHNNPKQIVGKPPINKLSCIVKKTNKFLQLYTTLLDPKVGQSKKTVTQITPVIQSSDSHSTHCVLIF